MALIDRKVNDWSQAVSSLDDKPKMTAAALKAAFDSNSNQLKPAINGIIDDLTSINGASNIGLTPIDGLSGSNVQAVLQAISLLIKSNDVDLASLERLFTADGAALVGLQPVSGVSASNLQQAIISLADTISKIDPYLGNPVAISQGGTDANDSQNALYNLGAKPNDNLLDNAYFAGDGTDGSFPISQYGSKISRWFIEDGANISFTDKGIKLTSSSQTGILQRLSQKVLQNVNVTLSIFITEISGTLRLFMINRGYVDISDTGVYKITYTGSDLVESDAVYFRIVSGEATVLAVKLEYGSRQSLGYKDNQGQWHLFEIPNHEYEFLKCQKYLLSSSTFVWWGSGVIGNPNNIIQMFVPTPVKMRTIPSIFGQFKIWDGIEVYAPDNIVVSNVGANGLYLQIMNSKFNRPIGTPIFLFSDSLVGFSAEL